MFGFQQKITEDAKRQKNQFEQTNQACESYSIMTEILELLKREYKVTEYYVKGRKEKSGSM